MNCTKLRLLFIFWLIFLCSNIIVMLLTKWSCYTVLVSIMIGGGLVGLDSTDAFQ